MLNHDSKSIYLPSEPLCLWRVVFCSFHVGLLSGFTDSGHSGVIHIVCVVKHCNLIMQ